MVYIHTYIHTHIYIIYNQHTIECIIRPRKLFLTRTTIHKIDIYKVINQLKGPQQNVIRVRSKTGYPWVRIIFYCQLWVYYVTQQIYVYTVVCNFGVYFIHCLATREMNTKMFPRYLYERSHYLCYIVPHLLRTCLTTNLWLNARLQ